MFNKQAPTTDSKISNRGNSYKPDFPEVFSRSFSQPELYFAPFRQNIVGIQQRHHFRAGQLPIIYADWTASGRLYSPIEQYMINIIGPYVANTHTEATVTGTMMTHAYQQARTLIKAHVGASEDDLLLFAGFGMTGAINKFQRILGLRLPERYANQVQISEEERPLVVVTHMEHHSNQTSWLECCCDLHILKRGEDGLPDLNHLEDILKANQHRKHLIGSFTACSNVTGIVTPYHQMAELMHRYGGVCFVDFASSAPYVEINMHPAKPEQKLDAIFFSPHKFLGGPGSSGVVLFDKSLHRNQIPDHPGGGTVSWTDPWGGRLYYDNIEVREDGGTPGFLPAIRASLAILLKEEMGTNQILNREHELVQRMWQRLERLTGVKVLETTQQQRLGIFSLYAPDIHHNLLVKLLNDYYGIQARSGCSCAGTYGHVLMNIDAKQSRSVMKIVEQGNFAIKPGWVRLSLHPTMTNKDIDYIADSLEDILDNHRQWRREYEFDNKTGDFSTPDSPEMLFDLQASFRLDLSQTQQAQSEKSLNESPDSSLHESTGSAVKPQRSPLPKLSRKGWGLILGGMAMLAGGFGGILHFTRDSQVPETVLAPAIAVNAVTLRSQPVANTLELSGTIRPANQAILSTRVTGRITQLSLDAGDRFRKGDVLGRVDVQDMSAQTNQARLGVAQAKSALAQTQAELSRSQAALNQLESQKIEAQAALQLAKIDQSRMTQLHREGAVSQERLDQANTTLSQKQAKVAQMDAGIREAQAAVQQSQAEIEQSHSAVNQAAAGVKSASVSESYGTIVAPFDGVVVQKLAYEGEMTTPGTALLKVENPDHLQLEISVPEENLTFVRLGQPVKVQVDAVNQILNAMIQQIVPAADPNSRSFLIKIPIHSAGKLISGMFGRVTLTRGTQNGISIPTNALIQRGQLQGVYVVETDADKQPIAVLRWVKTGKTHNGQVEIVSGLTTGDRVITSNLSQMSDGQPIMVNL